jgi:F-type H+-transporting ATPase subunit a
MIFSPLAQFDIIVIFSLNILNYLFIYINNLNLAVFSVYVVFFITLFIVLEEIRLIPDKVQFYFELVFLFVYVLVYEQVGKKGLKYFPFLMSIFLTIILMNIVSLFPYSFAVTSHFI